MKADVGKSNAFSTPRVKYFARVTKQKSGGFLVEFPDLPGCLTEGDTLEDALANAREALSGWLFAAIKNNEEIPSPVEHKGKNYHMIAPELDVEIPLIFLWMRKEKGLSQKQMADALGVSQQAYSKLEIPGKSNPRLKTLTRLFSVHNLDIELVNRA